MFVLAYIEIYVFRGNPFQAQSLEQSYHPTQPFKHSFLMSKLINFLTLFCRLMDKVI
jgi:hypothetical protein